MRVLLLSVAFGVEASCYRIGCKTEKPEEKKTTGLITGAFLHLLVWNFTLCIIAGVRHSRQAIEWKAIA